MDRNISLALLPFLVVGPLDAADVQTYIDANVVSYVEEAYVLQEGAVYDHRPLVIPIDPPPVSPREPIVPELGRSLESSFDVVTTSTISPPDSDVAVGPNHVLAVNNAGVFGFLKDGTPVLNTSLIIFFSSLAAMGPPFDPRVFYDDFFDRYVVLANDVDSLPSPTDSDLLIAVSDDGDPSGSWHLLKIPTLLPSFDPDGPNGGDPASPHRADRPQVGIEASQIYVSFNMFPVGGVDFGGTAIWNIWKWDVTQPVPSGGFYDGQTTTIQAGIRPFSAGDDFANETQLAPVRIHGSIVSDPVDRGIFLAGYGGALLGGSEPTLQIFWMTTIGPSVNKMLVPMGSVDDLAGHPALPGAPQRNGGSVDTGFRFLFDGEWRNDSMWLATVVVPPAGIDTGETTAHWVEVNAPATSGISLADQGNVSGDTFVSGTHTYYPSLDVSDDGILAIGFSLSAATLELSSGLSFLGTHCDVSPIALAPELLRRGSEVWTGDRWGDYSGTTWDSGFPVSPKTAVEPAGSGKVVAIPRVGGLHHRYTRQAA